MTGLDLAGHVLAGRYRLLRPLAAGASGRAYVAEDLELHRRVAVKVLHEDLAGDLAFLERFRSEARTVASLQHPNIVTLFDWGDDPVPFMVLELLTGGSLAALLRGGGRLTPEQAALLGTQVAAALEHAHGRGLAHRDIKPANLLFDEHGTIRVADFGLARALAESGVTAPVDGIVGTARYAAPEQATGAPLDGRSDLYSLALVMVEAVTGTVPLMKDAPLATLAARAAEPLEAPMEMGALGVVVERAGLPYPGERYPDAGSMRRGIEAAAGMLPQPEPLPVAGLGVEVDDADPTEMSRTVHTPPTTAAPRSPAAPPDDPAAARREPRRRLVPYIIMSALVLALASAAVAVTAAAAPQVHVPNLVGGEVDDASAEAGRTGLLVEVGERIQAPDPPGTVVGQDPPAGETLDRGGEVRLIVSTGPPPVELPAVVGKDRDPAVEALEKAGFEVTVEERFHDTVEAGRVVLQEPSTARAPEGATVNLVVSRGPEPVVVPNVVGSAAEAARTTLGDAGFETVVSDEFSDTVEKGMVIRQNPVGGQDAIPGSRITIVVSKGPDTVAVPDVRGMSVEDATGALRFDGLEADVVNYEPGSKVKRQDPDPGTTVRRGTTITLFL